MEGVRLGKEELVRTYGISQRLAVRVGALLAKGFEVSGTLLEIAGPGSAIEKLLLHPEMLASAERPTVEAIRKLARETGAASEGELALAESPGGGRVLALEEELLAQEGWRGQAAKEPTALAHPRRALRPGFGGDAGAGPEGGERALQRGGDRAAEARRAGRARRRRARLGAPQARLRADQRARKRRHLPARAARFGRAGPERGDESDRVARLQPRHGRRDSGALRGPRPRARRRAPAHRRPHGPAQSRRAENRARRPPRDVPRVAAQRAERPDARVARRGGRDPRRVARDRAGDGARLHSASAGGAGEAGRDAARPAGAAGRGGAGGGARPGLGGDRHGQRAGLARAAAGAVDRDRAG